MANICRGSHQLLFVLIYTCVHIASTNSQINTSVKSSTENISLDENPDNIHANGNIQTLNRCPNGEAAEGEFLEYFQVPRALRINNSKTPIFRLRNSGLKCNGFTKTLTFTADEDSGSILPSSSSGSPAIRHKMRNAKRNRKSANPAIHTYDSLNLNSGKSENLVTPNTNSSGHSISGEDGGQLLFPLSSFFLTEEGFLVYGNDVYHPNEYCISKTANQGHANSITLCVPDCEKSSTTICLNKCCPFGQSINLRTQRCTNSGPQVWNLQNVFDVGATFLGKKSLDTEELIKIPIDHVTFHMNIAGFPANCPEQWLRFPHVNRPLYDEFGLMPNTEFRVLSDGSVVTYDELKGKWYPIRNGIDGHQSICVDGLQNFGKGLFYSGHANDDILIHCRDPVPVEIESGREFYYGPVHILVLFLSSTFLLVTAIVYYLTMKKEKVSVHGWTVLCQIVSMFFTYIFLGTSHMFSLFSDLHLNSSICVLNGVLSHFFTLSTFFWMTALDFDIWKTFRSINSCRHSKGKKNLVYYVLFAMGLPVIIIAISLYLEYGHYGTNSDFITPQYGRHSCYMSRAALGYYVYYIIGLLLSCNVILISLTFKNIYQARASTQNVLHKSRVMERQQSSKIPASLTAFLELNFGFGHRKEPLFKLFAKLLVVTGITWILDVISWIFYTEIMKCKARHWIWLFFDSINYLQPVAIFVIFVCKRKTLHILANRFVFVRKIKPNWATSKKSSLSSRSSTRQASRKIGKVTNTLGTTIGSPKSTSQKNGNGARNEQPLIALDSNRIGTGRDNSPTEMDNDV